MNIGYKLVKNNTTTAEKAPYVGMAIPVGSLAYDDILTKMLDSGTFMTKSTAEYFLNAFYEFAAEKIGEEAVRISTGTVSLYPAISGSFPSEDAAFDPANNTLYVGASLSQSLRDEVAGLQPDYAGDAEVSSAVRIRSVMDLATETMGVIVGTGDFRLAGVELTVPDGADESLALYQQDGLIKVCDITVSGNDGGLYLTCHLPGTATIAKGDYKIRLASHGLDPTAPLVVRTLSVTLAEGVAPAKRVIKMTTLTATMMGETCTVETTGENFADVLNYSESGGYVTMPCKYSINGGAEVDGGFMGSPSNPLSLNIASGVSAGDTIKVTLTPDPAKTDVDQNLVTKTATAA